VRNSTLFQMYMGAFASTIWCVCKRLLLVSELTCASKEELRKARSYMHLQAPFVS
jgi:hypothetical protein